jgi:hypothetical protein
MYAHFTRQQQSKRSSSSCVVYRQGIQYLIITIRKRKLKRSAYATNTISKKVINATVEMQQLS